MTEEKLTVLQKFVSKMDQELRIIENNRKDLQWLKETEEQKLTFYLGSGYGSSGSTNFQSIGPEVKNTLIDLLQKRLEVLEYEFAKTEVPQ